MSTVAAPWGGGALLLELGERRLHELNPSAAAVWDRWADGLDRDQIVRELASVVDIAPARLGEDVDAALAAFADAGLTPGPRCSQQQSAAGPAGAPGIGPFRAGQARFRVIGPAPLLAEADVLLDPLRADRHDTGTEVVLDADDVTTLVARVNELAVTGSPAWVAFHAGVVCVDGSLVMLPGPSGRGKSTLTAALVAAGAAYLSDELALLDPDRMLVVPHPKPLSLAGGTPGVKDLVDPRTLGAVGTAAPVAAVVAPTYVTGAATALEPVDPRGAVDLLLANSFDFAPAGEAGFRALVEVAATVPVWRLQVCDLDEAVAAVRRSVGSALAAPAGAGGRRGR